MKNTVSRWMSALALGASLAAAGMVTLAPAPRALAHLTSESSLGDDLGKPGDKVVVTLSNGEKREGTIVEETAVYIKLKIKTAVGMADTTFQKSELSGIERKAGDVPVPAAAKPAEAVKSAPASKPAAAAATAPPKKDAKSADPAEASDPNAKRIYEINITGEFGHDCTATPMKEALNDAKKMQPDIILFKIDTDYSFYGQKKLDFDADAAKFAFNQLETVREIATLFTDGIRDDPDWKTRSGGKPQIVMWVKKAMGGVAFMPFVAADVYFTSEAHHGGIGYLEYIFKGTGDEVAQEKQYSLRLARAMGLAEKGGHEPKLIRAMARVDYVLSVSYVGGQPVYFEDESGDELLTNDGDESKGHKDSMEDVVRFRGKAVLTLDAPTALKLGFSKGTADTLEELADELNISRSYVLLKGRSDSIFSNWAKDVKQAEDELHRLWKEFGKVQVTGGTPEERNSGRGKQIRILENMRKLLTRYKEALNPRAIQGVPGDSQIDIMIEQIKQQMRMDKPPPTPNQ